MGMRTAEWGNGNSEVGMWNAERELKAESSRQKIESESWKWEGRSGNRKECGSGNAEVGN